MASSPPPLPSRQIVTVAWSSWCGRRGGWEWAAWLARWYVCTATDQAMDLHRWASLPLLAGALPRCPSSASPPPDDRAAPTEEWAASGSAPSGRHGWVPAAGRATASNPRQGDILHASSWGGWWRPRRRGYKVRRHPRPEGGACDGGGCRSGRLIELLLPASMGSCCQQPPPWAATSGDVCDLPLPVTTWCHGRQAPIRPAAAGHLPN
jgi:hypothetical protein